MPVIFVAIVCALACVCTTPTLSLAGVSTKTDIAPTKNAPPSESASWLNLTEAQRQALAPLAAEWDKFEVDGKKKWLEIADKFRSMKQVEQARVQQKMQTWAKLTPEQRVIVRENYIRSNKLKPDQRNEKWKEYQQLSPEQKSQLAEHSNKKNLVTNLPSPAESKIKKLQPLKLSNRTEAASPLRPPKTPAGGPGNASKGLLVAPSGVVSNTPLNNAPLNPSSASAPAAAVIGATSAPGTTPATTLQVPATSALPTATPAAAPAMPAAGTSSP